MSFRIDRLNSEMRKAIADIIDNKIKNPQKTEMVGVTSVEVAKDLKTAKVYLSIYGNPDKIESTFAAIVRSAGFVKKELASIFRDLRCVPTLEFRLDKSMEYSAKIETILEDIRRDVD